MKKIGEQNNIYFLRSYSCTKRNENTKGFTLVELIVVITILAILGTIGFLSFQSYTVYSRDVTRLSNLNVLKSGLEIQYTKGGYFAEPDDYVKITASGTTIRKQGLFGKKALRTIKANTDASKDPLTGEYYDYITDNNLSEYQIVGYMEGDETSYKTPLLSKEGLGVVQASGTGYTMKTKGQDLGVVFKDNIAVHKVSGNVGTEIDIREDGTEYTIKFDEGDEVTSSSGSELFSNVYNRSKALLKNKDLAKLDESLVLYFDMETTTQSGGLTVLKDLSKSGYNGTCYNSGTIVNCGEGGPLFQTDEGSTGKSMYFDGVDDKIGVGDKPDLDIGDGNKTFFIKFKLPNYIPDSWSDELFGKHYSYYPKTGFRLGVRGSFDPDSTNHGKLLFYLGNAENLNGNQIHYFSDNKINNNLYNNVGIIFNQVDSKLLMMMNGGKKEFLIENFNNGKISSLPFLIGDGGGVGNRNLKGLIDEIRVYNRALTEKEFLNVYGSTLK